MAKFQLIRGDALLGTVTLAPEERIDGGAPWDVGWLAPEQLFQEVRRQFEQERQLIDAAMVLESAAKGATAESEALLEQAAALQREIIRPGVHLIDCTDGHRIDVDEIHIEGTRVIWR